MFQTTNQLMYLLHQLFFKTLTVPSSLPYHCSSKNTANRQGSKRDPLSAAKNIYGMVRFGKPMSSC